MRYEVKQIDPISVFRLVFFLTLILGGIASLIFIIISLFIGKLLLAILIFAVGVPLVALIKAFFVYLFILIYNLFAKKFGGIIIYISNE